MSREDDLKYAEAALHVAMAWLNEKKDAPIRAKLHWAAVEIQKAQRALRHATAEPGGTR